MNNVSSNPEMEAFRKSLGLSPRQSRQVAEEPSEMARRSVRVEQAQHVGMGTYGAQERTPTLPLAEAVSVTDAADVKNKLMAMWHSVKYGKTAFNLDSKVSLSPGNAPVWLLGRRYHRGPVEVLRGDFDQQEREAAIAAFQLDFSSRLWFTYRREFTEFIGTNITSDCGWGCMIRSGQMLLANTLLLQLMGRRWLWKQEKWNLTKEDARNEVIHRSIVRLFGDSPQSDVSPLSIHTLMSIAQEILGKKPGDWFGPSTTAHLLKKAVARSDHDLLQNLCVYVARDCTIYKQDVKDTCQKKALEVRERSQRRRHQVEDGRNSEDFSLLEYPYEYPGLLVTDSAASGSERKGKLFSGVIDGVPYFLDPSPDQDDFQLLSDGTENYSLSQEVQVGEEVWLAEEASTRHRPKRLPSSSTDRVKSRNSSLTSPTVTDWCPVLILVPLRLGSDKLNPLYIPCLKAMLASETCIGIIGGRPRHSLFFVGFQDDSLIHMDPHLAQDNVDVLRHNFALDSFHCGTPRKMNIYKMDPSCCIGFFCPTKASFEAWCEITKSMTVPPGQASNALEYPMFGIAEGRSSRHDLEEATPLEAEALNMSCDPSEAEQISEDFVFI